MRSCGAYTRLALRTDCPAQQDGWHLFRRSAIVTKLWQKSYSLNEQVERFEAAQNSALDARLIRHDVWGSLAHAAMLARSGVLTQSEHRQLQEALRSILDVEAAHEFTTTLADEDVHTRIENYLVALAGDAGKKIHTARSRNDQVLV